MGAVVGKLNNGSITTSTPKTLSTITSIIIVNRDSVDVDFTIYIKTVGSTAEVAITSAPTTLSAGQAYVRDLGLVLLNTTNQVRIESTGNIDYHISISP